jgi:hypothetical protein
MIGGWLVQRIGLKPLMLVGCLCLGGGLVFHAAATSVWMVYLSRFLMGASLGFVGVTPNVVLVSNWFREKRGTALWDHAYGNEHWWRRYTPCRNACDHCLRLAISDASVEPECLVGAAPGCHFYRSGKAEN